MMREGYLSLSHETVNVRRQAFTDGRTLTEPYYSNVTVTAMASSHAALLFRNANRSKLQYVYAAYART